MNAEQYNKALGLASKLSQGETIASKEFKGIKELVNTRLKEIRNNCNLVMRQLKETNKG